MGRPRKTREQYVKEYLGVIEAINLGIPYRKVAEIYGIGLSTVQRLVNKGLCMVHR